MTLYIPKKTTDINIININIFENLFSLFILLKNSSCFFSLSKWYCSSLFSWFRADSAALGNFLAYSSHSNAFFLVHSFIFVGLYFSESHDLRNGLAIDQKSSLG